MKKLVVLTVAFTALLPAAAASALQSWGTNDKIVFSSSRAQDGLYSMSSTGSGQTKVSSVDVFEEQAAWSPDSKRILFVSFEDGDTEIWIMRANGNGRRNLTDNSAADSGPAWEPGGKSFLFTSNRNGASDLYRYKLETDRVRRLTTFGGVSGLAASPSPDGEMIAFSKERSAGFNEIYTMNADGTGIKNLTKTPGGGEQTPAWSPNGNQIAFSYQLGSGSTIDAIKLNDGTRREVTPVGFAPSWSPDGAFLTYQAFDGMDVEIYRVRGNGSAELNLTDNTVFDTFID